MYCNNFFISQLQVNLILAKGNDPLIISIPLIIGNVPLKKDFDKFVTDKNLEIDNRMEMPKVFQVMPNFRK